MPETHNESDHVAEGAEKPSGPVLVALVHNDIDKDMEGKLFFIDEDGWSEEVPFRAFSGYLKHRQNLISWKKNPAESPGSFFHKSEKKVLLSRKAQTEKAVGKNFFKELVKCKRMTLLIDSLGGSMEGEERMMRLMDMVHRNGGTVNAFVGSKAASAAAGLLEKVDHTTALGESVLMWHTSQNDEGTDKETVAQDTAVFTKYFRQKVTSNQEHVAARLREVIQDPQNDDNRIYFTGREMDSFGALEAVSSTAELKQAALKDTPELGEAIGYARKKIDRFFEANRLEETVRAEFGHSPILQDGKAIYDHTVPPEVHAAVFKHLEGERDKRRAREAKRDQAV